jgi:hypothetical protein
MSNYKVNVERMAEDEAFDPYRETGKKCQYVNHRGGDDVPAIIMVEVDNSDCCKTQADKEKYHTVRLCWRCTQYGYRDQYYCKCEDPDNGKHTAEDLTFKGELNKA